MKTASLTLRRKVPVKTGTTCRIKSESPADQTGIRSISSSAFYCGKEGSSKERNIVSMVDNETSYKHLRKTRIKFWELGHDDYVIKFKIGLQNALLKRVVRGDIADENSTFIESSSHYKREEYCDLMVASDKTNYFTGIEYEKSLKNKYSYIGRTIKDKIGRTKHIKGYFERRQEDPYMAACLIICETTGIFNKIFEYMREASVVQNDGKSLKLDKFYIADKTGHNSVQDFITKGKVLKFSMSSKRSIENDGFIDFVDFILLH